MNVSYFEGWNAGFRSGAVVDDIIGGKGRLGALGFYSRDRTGF